MIKNAIAEASPDRAQPRVPGGDRYRPNRCGWEPPPPQDTLAAEARPAPVLDGASRWVGIDVAKAHLDVVPPGRPSCGCESAGMMRFSSSTVPADRAGCTPAPRLHRPGQARPGFGRRRPWRPLLVEAHVDGGDQCPARGRRDFAAKPWDVWPRPTPWMPWCRARFGHADPADAPRPGRTAGDQRWRRCSSGGAVEMLIPTRARRSRLASAHTSSSRTAYPDVLASLQARLENLDDAHRRICSPRKATRPARLPMVHRSVPHRPGDAVALLTAQGAVLGTLDPRLDQRADVGVCPFNPAILASARGSTAHSA